LRAEPGSPACPHPLGAPLDAHDLLTGRTIIVTGGATGIGQAFALGCAAQGAHVVVADRNPADETLQAIAQAGGRATYVEVDVSDEASTRAMAEAALKATGRIDGLVNNAAYFREVRLTPFEEIDAHWHRIKAEVEAGFVTVQAEGLKD
jgi:3-oxoacyl-[acyl-carrier protein] reductase